MNFPNLNSEAMPEFLKDSDNVLILILALMLIKEKSNLSLIVALMSILIIDSPPPQTKIL
ncbi:MAG: hypothetical protein FWF94_01410 [Oscillospiraceae bacterium]|nr:hypothetical protein [Oscillospiraceae bacterium]